MPTFPSDPSPGVVSGASPDAPPGWAPLVAVSVTYGDHAAAMAALMADLAAAGIGALALVGNGLSPGVAARLAAAAPTDLRLALLHEPRNLGPAAGYARAMAHAFDALGAGSVLLLDHDNRLSPAAATALRAAAAAAPGGALCALRADRAYLRAAAAGDPTAAAPPPGGVFNHDLRILLRRALARLGLRRSAPAAPAALPSIEIAPYGGLMVSRAAWERVGGPRTDFVIYGDDFDYARRLASMVGLNLVPNAVVEDSEASWNHGPAPLRAWRRLARAQPDFRVFYAVRNAVYGDLRRRPRNVALLALNGAFFVAAVVAGALLERRPRNLLAVLRATWDGAAGRLGPHPDFPLPQPAPRPGESRP